MKTPGTRAGAVCVAGALAATVSLCAAPPPHPTGPDALPDAVVDLRTVEGARLVKGEWRYADAKVVEVAHRRPGPDLKPTGAPNRTLDVTPAAGAADFDDSLWELLDADRLEDRHSTGKLCFGWYRVRMTLPEKVGRLDTRGATVVLEVVVDDYAEVWVDGKLPIAIGQRGGHAAAGWNAPNRVVLTRDAEPGQRFQVAVFAANAPLSSPPENYVWIRSAALELYGAGRRRSGEDVPFTITPRHAPIDALIAPDARMERLAAGFRFTEGPVWSPDGSLLFSDPNANTIYRWTPDGDLTVFRPRSGYSGFDIGEYGQPGSNGLAIDPQGRLTICEHGNRRVTRLEKNGTLAVLADRYRGKRLNSPNDLVYRSDGVLFFTDPAFGLPRWREDPRRELPFTGIFALAGGDLRLLSSELDGPNGIALSPDEKRLYVANWDTERKVVLCFDVAPDASVADGRVLFDMGGAPGEEALDGIEVDELGNLYISGPGGLWIISPAGEHLATVAGPELPANFAWGDADRRSLYLTARTGLYRLRMKVAGTRPVHEGPGT